MPEINRGPVRARDLRENVKTYGDIKGIMITLELLIEEFSAYRNYMRDLTEQHSQLVDMLQGNLALSEQLHNNMNSLKRIMDQGDNLNER